MPFPNIGPGELILILIIALIVLGPGKLPDVASSLGKSVREFRKAATDVTEAGRLDAAASTTPTPPASTAAGSTAPSTPAPAIPGPADDASPEVTRVGAEPSRDSNP